MFIVVILELGLFLVFTNIRIEKNNLLYDHKKDTEK